MSFPKIHIILFLLLSLVLSFTLVAQKQEVKVELGENELLVNERFFIKISVRAEGSDVGEFPTIEGFTKGGRSVAHTEYKEGKKRGIQHTITQNYTAVSVGTFKLSPFNLLVNNETISLEGTTLRVSTEKPTTILETETIVTNIREDALILLSTEKKEVFIGEGFVVSLGFYVADANTVGWNFPTDLTTQVDAIARKIKPENCLESRTLITDVLEEKITINNKKYTRYKVFQAIYYPLNGNRVKIPAVELMMLKKIQDNKKAEIKKFTTQPLEINVKPLPEHPLKDKVAVGKFTLKEWLEKSKNKTGESFTYKFWIEGEGNFATINFETPSNDDSFDFFPSKINNVLKTGVKAGEKIIEYRIFPKLAGNYPLKNYIQWIYFNTEKASYDTLQSKITLEVSGEKIIAARSSLDDIYDNLENIPTAIPETDFRVLVKNIANVAVIGMVIALLVALQWKKNR